MIRADEFDRHANLGEDYPPADRTYDEAPALDTTQPAGARLTSQTPIQTKGIDMSDSTMRDPWAEACAVGYGYSPTLDGHHELRTYDRSGIVYVFETLDDVFAAIDARGDGDPPTSPSTVPVVASETTPHDEKEHDMSDPITLDALRARAARRGYRITVGVMSGPQDPWHVIVSGPDRIALFSDDRDVVAEWLLSQPTLTQIARGETPGAVS